MMLDLIDMYKKYKISPKGVIHVGAHEGGEIKVYQSLGITKIIFIEANPEVFEKLKKNIVSSSNIQLVCCAISNEIGRTSLHVTSMDQSSSILPLKHHSVVYPNITETKCIDVRCTTLDSLMIEEGLNPADFNFINIDIQGAELLAFQGATNLLSNNIQAINTEVNFKEMYESCALKDDIDTHLAQHGFICKEVTTPYHSSWGDAFYVKG